MDIYIHVYICIYMCIYIYVYSQTHTQAHNDTHTRERRLSYIPSTCLERMETVKRVFRVEENNYNINK